MSVGRHTSSDGWSNLRKRCPILSRATCTSVRLSTKRSLRRACSKQRACEEHVEAKRRRRSNSIGNVSTCSSNFQNMPCPESWLGFAQRKRIRLEALHARHHNLDPVVAHHAAYEKFKKDAKKKWRTCSTCGVRKKRMSKCGGCRLHHYCSEACQRLDWPRHKRTCSPDGAFLPGPNSVLAFGACIIGPACPAWGVGGA